jgi:hypothetical protein
MGGDRDIIGSSRHKKGKSVPAAPRSGAGNNLNNSHYDPDESRHVINGSVLTAGGGVNQKSTIEFLQEEEEFE